MLAEHNYLGYSRLMLSSDIQEAPDMLHQHEYIMYNYKTAFVGIS